MGQNTNPVQYGRIRPLLANTGQPVVLDNGTVLEYDQVAEILARIFSPESVCCADVAATGVVVRRTWVYRGNPTGVEVPE